MGEKRELYRYVDDQDANGVHVRLKKYMIIKETDCGFWIIPDYMKNYQGMHDGCKRWVRKTSLSGYANQSKHDAMRNFEKRKKRQIQMSEYWLRRAKSALSIAEYKKENDEDLKTITIEANQ
jgi:hypothetical protein